MTDEQMNKRIQFERTFMLWKARKDEEHRAAQAAKKRAEEDKEKRLERKRVLGLVAYEKWKVFKLRESETQLQEKHQLQVQSRLDNATRDRRLEQAQMAFKSWKERKKHKDIDRKKSKEEAEPPRQTVSTPSLSGYCSVWECDRRLAQKMLQVCPRQSKQRSNSSGNSVTSP